MRRMTRFVGTLSAALALVGGALVLGAPAGAADKGGSGGSATGSPVKIGFVCSCTGPLASSIQVAHTSYQAWVSWANAHGGLNGHKIQLDFVDDQTNPGTSISQVQKLVNQDHVIAIVDGSNVDQGWTGFLKEQHVPVVGQNISSLLMFSDPNFFPEGQTNDSLPTAVALAAKKVGSKKMALLYCAESPICQELVGPEKQAAKAAGVDLTYSVGISATASSYAAECLAAQQSGATTVFIADAVTVVQTVAQSCSKQGWKPTIIADDGAVSQSFLKTPLLEDGMIAMQPDIPFNVTNTKATKTMVAAFKKYQPGLMKDPNYNEEVVESWTAGQLLALAAKRGNLGQNGSATSQQLYDGLYSMSKETLGGLAPDLSFTKDKANSIPCWFWQRTKNGKFTTPYGLKPVCANLGSSSGSGSGNGSTTSQGSTGTAPANASGNGNNSSNPQGHNGGASSSHYPGLPSTTTTTQHAGAPAG